MTMKSIIVQMGSRDLLYEECDVQHDGNFIPKLTSRFSIGSFSWLMGLLGSGVFQRIKNWLYRDHETTFSSTKVGSTSQVCGHHRTPHITLMTLNLGQFYPDSSCVLANQFLQLKRAVHRAINFHMISPLPAVSLDHYRNLISINRPITFVCGSTMLFSTARFVVEVFHFLIIPPILNFKPWNLKHSILTTYPYVFNWFPICYRTSETGWCF